MTLLARVHYDINFLYVSSTVFGIQVAQRIVRSFYLLSMLIDGSQHDRDAWQCSDTRERYVLQTPSYV